MARKKEKINKTENEKQKCFWPVAEGERFKTGCHVMETGLGDLCGNEENTTKTGQEGAGNRQVWKKKRQGLCGTQVKHEASCVLLLLRKRQS